MYFIGVTKIRSERGLVLAFDPQGNGFRQCRLYETEESVADAFRFMMATDS